MPDRSPDLWIIAFLTAFPSSTQYTFCPKKQISFAETNLSFSIAWLPLSAGQWLLRQGRFPLTVAGPPRTFTWFPIFLQFQQEPDMNYRKLFSFNFFNIIYAGCQALKEIFVLKKYL